MDPLHRTVTAAAFALALLLPARTVTAAFTWPGCGAVAESEFKYQAIIGRRAATAPKLVDTSMLEPIKMAFQMQPDNSVDIYWVERGGAIKRYIAAQNKAVNLGKLGVFTEVEQGLTGLALDPGFRDNRWLYVYYAPSAEANVFRVSRFTLSADFSSLDANSEKVLVRIPSQRANCCHTGGAMAFDLYGDLWITVGKNAPDYPNSINEATEALSTEGTAADASDMRGGLLRIHPDNSSKGYTVPSGNYGEYWAAQFRAQGNAALAAEYADTAKTLPELYVKGTRNAYSLSVDPVRRWEPRSGWLPPVLAVLAVLLLAFGLTGICMR
jgi:cytochrome c